MQVQRQQKLLYELCQSMNYHAWHDSLYLSDVSRSNKAMWNRCMWALYTLYAVLSDIPKGTVQDKCVGNLQVCLNTHYSFLRRLSEDLQCSFIISYPQRHTHINAGRKTRTGARVDTAGVASAQGLLKEPFHSLWLFWLACGLKPKLMKHKKHRMERRPTAESMLQQLYLKIRRNGIYDVENNPLWYLKTADECRIYSRQSCLETAAEQYNEIYSDFNNSGSIIIFWNTY